MEGKPRQTWKRPRVDLNTLHNPKKKLDLRNTEHYAQFRATKYVFEVSTDRNFVLTPHKNTPLAVKESMLWELEKLITESMSKIVEAGGSMSNIVHFYLHCEGLSTDFKWAGGGGDVKTVGEMMNSLGVKPIIDRLMMMIQSGRDVRLNEHTRLTVMTFSPPEHYQNRLHLLRTGGARFPKGEVLHNPKQQKSDDSRMKKPQKSEEKWVLI